MERGNQQIECRESITYEELITSLQMLFDVDEKTVENLFLKIYKEDLIGNKHMKAGTWTFIPYENPEDTRALIIKNTGCQYLIGSQEIKTLNKHTGKLDPKKILKVYKKWYKKKQR